VHIIYVCAVFLHAEFTLAIVFQEISRKWAAVHLGGRGRRSQVVIVSLGYAEQASLCYIARVCLKKTKNQNKTGSVAHACNPSYSRG
jgi:hypothetical protein